jgi:hypothetical protein
VNWLSAEFINRASPRLCNDCLRPVRWWHHQVSRHNRCVHSACWERRRLAKQIVAARISKPPKPDDGPSVPGFPNLRKLTPLLRPRI